MQPIIETTFASFVPDGNHEFHWFEAAEAARLLERIDTERLAAKSIYFDPFDLRPIHQRERYQAAEAAELPVDFDPFDVADLVVPEETTVQWSEDDQRAAAAFGAAARYDVDASLDASDKFLAARTPFNVTLEEHIG